MICFSACSSKFLKYDKVDKLKEISEFDNTVKIVLPADEDKDESETDDKDKTTKSAETTTVNPDGTGSAVKTPVIAEATKTPPPKAVVSAANKKTANKKTTDKKPAKNEKRQPELESDIGFEGRRPIKDPFRIGEKVVHDVSYLGMTAGSLMIEVKPFAEVDGKRSYNFKTTIKTSSLFNSFYSVDDYVTTLVDFETLVPSVYTLHVKESSQLREARMFADVKKNTATFWEKKVTKKSGEEEKKIQWDILPYSQNVFSAIFYLRNFHWTLGAEHAFRVADNGNNLVFKAKAIRKEKISTDVGDFDAIVIRPEIELQGQFKPTGENLVWLSDDERKFILRIESKIKIGSLVSEIVKLDKGEAP